MDIAYHPDLIDASAYVAPNATIIGEVHVAADASVWFACVLRAEHAPIILGSRTNIQDLTVVHADIRQPCVLGEGVTVGHRAVVHGATVEDGALIGIGSVVLNGARIGQEALVGAGAVVPEGVAIPARHLAFGVPARVIRKLSDAEVEHQRTVAVQYVAQAQAFIAAGEHNGGRAPRRPVL